MKNCILLLCIGLMFGLQACKSKDVRSEGGNTSEIPVITGTVSAATVKRTFPGIPNANITDQYKLLWSVNANCVIQVDSIVMVDTTITKHIVTIQDRAFKKGEFSVEKGALVTSLFERVINRSNDSKQFDSKPAIYYISIEGEGQIQIEAPGFEREKDIFAP